MWGFRKDKGVGKSSETSEGEAVIAESSPKAGVVTTTTVLRDLLLITYAVPVERVRPHLPKGLLPDLLPRADGELCAFVQTLCAYYEDARWSLLPGRKGVSYHQVSYRILTRRNGVRGAFIQQTMVSSSELQYSRRALEETMSHARFSVYVDGDPARAAYRRYQVRVAGDGGKTELGVTALTAPPTQIAPFTNHEEMARFLVSREELYFRVTLPKNAIGLTPIQYSAVIPTWGILESSRLTHWTNTGILREDELQHPQSVLIAPEVTIVTSPPRYAKWDEKKTPASVKEPGSEV